jgi:hypothetical protein
VADDDGGGSAILPGPNGSDFAPIDYGSTVFIARAKRDIGLSFVGVLATDREHHTVETGPGQPPDTGGYNRVVGPDFQWRPSGQDSVAGQWLSAARDAEPSPSRGPVDRAGATGHASRLQWSHNSVHIDWFAQYASQRQVSRDTGFIRRWATANDGNTGWTFRPPTSCRGFGPP